MADSRKEESEPLLSNSDNSENELIAPSAPSLPPINSTELDPPIVGDVPPPVQPGELPPPYSPAPEGGVPMINCRVCQAMINLEGRMHQHVVKCSSCNEATPIKEAPAGKKYVRCPCNCLLICKLSSKRIACPRANCKRVINLSPTVSIASPSSTNVTRSASYRVICGHCNEGFRFPHKSALARCPYCRRVSSVGSAYAKNRCLIYIVVGLIFLGAGVGVTLGTYSMAENQGGIYVVWIGAFIVGILNLMRGIYYGVMTVSNFETGET
ncbi:type I phosphatidylinositol 4,5-bisphosphate 4-phosphatase-A-like [Asterias amurensis]|uniref:type I phosphatidylinositol 4,5-bisphosphate 4-phosphatase-A-like n=1 Tax=Asterias amurensis TaxID=7602 RepID=UPI003AB6ECB5